MKSSNAKKEMFLYNSQHIMFSDAAYYADITIFHTLLLNFLSTTHKKAKFRVLYTHTPNLENWSIIH
jgi:predicted nuclease of restriction endonuclease-like (RecB) superfamily